MAQPLMPKATAVWLIENTTLTFDQVAEFCGLHALEVQAIADGEVAAGIVGLDPVASGQLTREEISRCEGDRTQRLKTALTTLPIPQARPKGARYTPVSRRQDRPDAIAWLIRYHPELTDAQIAKLLGTTKPTIASVRNRTHWNIQAIRPRDPVTLGLCSQADLNAAVERAQRRAARAAKASGAPDIVPGSGQEPFGQDNAEDAETSST
ncbi:MAG: cell cycle transcriptional regulator TrcR [Alphaproteobacteria bacterium]